jgi:hypothetical protein
MVPLAPRADWLRARHQADRRQSLGGSAWPGRLPHHFHYADEEFLIVLSGQPSISSHGRPDVVVYPDSDKIGVGERLPRGGGLRAFFRRGDRVDYFDGERSTEG